MVNDLLLLLRKTTDIQKRPLQKSKWTMSECRPIAESDQFEPATDQAIATCCGLRDSVDAIPPSLIKATEELRATEFVEVLNRTIHRDMTSAVSRSASYQQRLRTRIQLQHFVAKTFDSRAGPGRDSGFTNAVLEDQCHSGTVPVTEPNVWSVERVLIVINCNFLLQLATAKRRGAAVWLADGKATDRFPPKMRAVTYIRPEIAKRDGRSEHDASEWIGLPKGDHNAKKQS